LSVLVCAFSLTSFATIRVYCAQLRQLVEFQSDIFDNDENWQGIEIQELPPAHFAKCLSNGREIFGFLSLTNTCCLLVIAIFLSVPYFVERRRGHNHRINIEAR